MSREHIWDFWSAYYDRLWVQRVSIAPTRRAILECLAGSRPGKLLDAGCGTAQLLDDLLRTPDGAAWDYTGFDASASMLARAGQKHPAARLINAGVMDCACPAASFDIVVCAHAFPYFTDKPAAFARLAGWVRPGGQLLLAQACTENLYDRLILAIVRQTTSPARYLSVAAMGALAAPLLGQPQSVIRINRHPGVPSLRLFVWRKPA